MSKHVSRPSNPTIAGCIYLTGKIETWGRGVEKVVLECCRHGCPKPQYSVNPGEPGDIMARVDAAPGAIVEASGNKCDTICETISGPINGPIKERILQYIQQHSGCKQAEIVKEIDVPSRTLKRILAEFCQNKVYNFF